MIYFRFLMRHPHFLSFGVLLTLFSSFGQTYLISMFVPQILSEFSLNSGQFGTLYAAATLTSALCLPFFGKILDQVDLGRYTISVGIALTLSCWLLALSTTIPLLFLSLLGLRLSGQGLLGLTASTAMARMFTDFRGRALSIAGAGYPLGEGLLPILIVLLLQQVGWRICWGITGLFIALVFLPLIAHLIKRAPPAPDVQTHPFRAWSRREILSDWRFYLFLPGVLTVPFLLTGLFLYQTHLADFKMWSAPMMASGFTGYAILRMLSSILVGPWIDKLGANRTFPYSLIPLTLGLLILWTQSAGWALYLFFILAGISQGITGVMMTALWAQRYGPHVLGRIKGLVSMLIVFSTALSPILFGHLLTAGTGFAIILPGALLLSLCTIATSFLARELNEKGNISHSYNIRLF